MSPAPRMASLTWALRKRLAVWRVARSIVLRTAPRCSCILMMPSPSVLCSGAGLTISYLLKTGTTRAVRFITDQSSAH